jgi:maleylpyruvate isomerase
VSESILGNILRALMILYGYGLSSASYRVRIAMALKNLQYSSIIKNLRAGEHRLSEFLQINVQGFVPALKLDEGVVLTQSVAIIEYLDELYPDPPLLPAQPLERARVRALTQAIASDIHPLNNLRVLRYLEEKLILDKQTRDAWYRHWVSVGLTPWNDGWFATQPPGGSAMEIPRRWPMYAWCRRCSTRDASRSI